MPDMDGFTLAGLIKQRPNLAGTTIMMLSSVGQRGDSLQCRRELGVAAYLKPVRGSVLRDAILTVLSGPTNQTAAPTLVTRHSLREARGSLRILVAEDNPVDQPWLSGCSRNVVTPSPSPATGSRCSRPWP